jgi:disulfide bond formation protein DsbB/cytochrome c5
MTRFLERNSLYIALIAASTAMFGSLYFSEVAGYLPCSLCWYQRILMYPLVAILSVGLLRRDQALPYYVLPFSILGIIVASYHYLLQKTNIFDGGAVCQAGVPCTTVWINWAGFITIPFLALTAFVVITGMALIAFQTEENEEALPAGGIPWLPVGGTVGATLLLVVLLGFANRPDPNAFTIPEMTVVEGAAAHAMPVDIDGAALYGTACAACHGQNMEGIANLGNALSNNEFVADRSDEELLAFIRAGRMLDDPDNTSGLVMPPSGGQPNLTDAEILAIVQHLRTGQTTD